MTTEMIQEPEKEKVMAEKATIRTMTKITINSYYK